MTAKEIYLKTLAFSWVKLGLGVLNIVIDIVLFALLMGISVLFKNEGVGAVMFLVWLALAGIVNYALNHYIGYLVKAGHVAVISRAFKSGTIPDNPVAVGKEMVKECFGTSNVYFLLDNLVTGSVKQLQRTLGRVTGGLLGALPGGGSIQKLTELFLNISLGYIDECCLGYTFYRNDQNPYKSAADGVVIYAQNWKTLLKDAAKTTLVVILSLTVVTLVAFVLFGGLFRLFGWSGFVAFILSLLLAWTVKYAFIDSWILVKMMCSYMQVAPTTVITFDLYGKLSGLSGKFRELFKRSGEASSPKSDNSLVQPAAAIEQPHFCPLCGTPLTAGKPFCGNCGGQVV
ncbi:zinc ribbon domain-containing protein [Parabacteroides sp. AF48-14]|uniref:zinc ribbon domain-containing protein n=1 Tax=Parabacteroides sp. AF48-14 TaxID=2292052 RepID=UPI000EFE3C8D|nr:zinc ribbon domain-containing protein [Parabacteroides sp. AF48-14]RHO70747.1 zinc ribbon domain-containing protein [Parabacteroides sp. AF48-14]